MTAPPVSWCFDRGVEVLVFIDAAARRMFAWPRDQWENAGFSLVGVRALPAAPRELHDMIAAAKGKGRIV